MIIGLRIVPIHRIVGESGGGGESLHGQRFPFLSPLPCIVSVHQDQFSNESAGPFPVEAVQRPTEPTAVFG